MPMLSKVFLPMTTECPIVTARKCALSAGTFHGMPPNNPMPPASSAAAIISTAIIHPLKPVSNTAFYFSLKPLKLNAFRIGL